MQRYLILVDGFVVTTFDASNRDDAIAQYIDTYGDNGEIDAVPENEEGSW